MARLLRSLPGSSPLPQHIDPSSHRSAPVTPSRQRRLSQSFTYNLPFEPRPRYVNLHENTNTMRTTMISRRSLATGVAGVAISNAAFAEPWAHSDSAAHQRADGALVPIIQEWQSQSPHTPGVAVGVQFSNGHVWNRGFGLADLTTRRPMPANAYMRIGSVTKTFTGTVLLQLVDEGLIGLDDPLSKIYLE